MLQQAKKVVSYIIWATIFKSEVKSVWRPYWPTNVVFKRSSRWNPKTRPLPFPRVSAATPPKNTPTFVEARPPQWQIVTLFYSRESILILHTVVKVYYTILYRNCTDVRTAPNWNKKIYRKGKGKAKEKDNELLINKWMNVHCHEKHTILYCDSSDVWMARLLIGITRFGTLDLIELRLSGREMENWIWWHFLWASYMLELGQFSHDSKVLVSMEHWFCALFTPWSCEEYESNVLRSKEFGFHKELSTQSTDFSSWP